MDRSDVWPLSKLQRSAMVVAYDTPQTNRPKPRRGGMGSWARRMPPLRGLGQVFCEIECYKYDAPPGLARDVSVASERPGAPEKELSTPLDRRGSEMVQSPP